MADRKIAYGTRTAVTITLDALASGSAQQGAYIDNATVLALDYELFLYLVIGAGTISGDRCAYVYVGGYDGAAYEDNFTGSNASITLVDPPNAKCIGQVNIPVQSVNYDRMFSVAQAFDGHIPSRFCVAVKNSCGIVFGTGCTLYYRAIYETIA